MQVRVEVKVKLHVGSPTASYTRRGFVTVCARTEPEPLE